MPRTISMMEIMSAGHALVNSPSTIMQGGIQIKILGSRTEIFERGQPVCSFKKVEVAGTDLIIDYPKTTWGEDGRGWGIMGMLIALYLGQIQGCKNVKLGSLIEYTSASYWAKFGIAGTDNNPLLTCMDRGIGWVLGHCAQRSPELTDFVLRDAQ